VLEEGEADQGQQRVVVEPACVTWAAGRGESASPRPHRPPVRDPMRLIGLGSFPLPKVFDVGLDVPLEPDDLRVPLEAQLGSADGRSRGSVPSLRI
jgi:hypothetical protein